MVWTRKSSEPERRWKNIFFNAGAREVGEDEEVRSRCVWSRATLLERCEDARGFVHTFVYYSIKSLQRIVNERVLSSPRGKNPPEYGRA
jgi:hypothetical protein